MVWKNPKNGTWFIPKNDLITPCVMYKQKSLQNHTIYFLFIPTKLWITPWHFIITPCAFEKEGSSFTPSQSYSHLKMVLFIHIKYVFTPCKFCSHRQDFIHIMKFLYSHTPISDHTLQTWFTPSRPWPLIRVRGKSSPCRLLLCQGWGWKQKSK